MEREGLGKELGCVEQEKTKEKERKEGTRRVQKAECTENRSRASEERDGG